MFSTYLHKILTKFCSRHSKFNNVLIKVGKFLAFGEVNLAIDFFFKLHTVTE